MLKRAWPHVVAAFVVFQVAANCVDAVPDVALGMNKRAWAEPRVKHELDVWARRLDVDRGRLEDTLWWLGATLLHARAAAETPFRGYLRVTGQRQSWAMFIAGTRDRDRFQVRARDCAVDDERCDWRVLYDRGDDEHAFLRPILEDARVRSAIFRWGWPQLEAVYQRGCRAIARRAFAAFPAVQAVQCRFERSRSPAPPGTSRAAAPPPASSSSWGRAQVVRRSALDVEVRR